MSDAPSIKEPILESLKDAKKLLDGLEKAEKAITHLKKEISNFPPPGTLPTRWEVVVSEARESLSRHQARINISIQILSASDINDAITKAKREGHVWLAAKSQIELTEIIASVVLAAGESKLRIGVSIAAAYAPKEVAKFQKYLSRLKVARGVLPVLTIAAEICSLIHSINVGDKYGVISSGTAAATAAAEVVTMRAGLGASGLATSVVLSLGGLFYVGEKTGDLIRDLRLEKEVKTLLRMAETAVVMNGSLRYYEDKFYAPSESPNFKELELLEECVRASVGRQYTSLYDLAKTLKQSRDTSGKHRAAINKLFTEVSGATSFGLAKPSLWPLQQSLVSQVVKTTIEIVADHYVRMGTVPKNKRHAVVAKLRVALTYRLKFK